MIATPFLAALTAFLPVPGPGPGLLAPAVVAAAPASQGTALTPAERRQLRRAQRAARRRARHGAGGAVTGQDQVQVGGGSVAATGGVTSLQAVPAQPGSPSSLVYIGSITTGTGFPEAFVLHTPTQLPNPQPAPLLVVFHQFGKSHTDLLNTGFVQAAFERGWYVVCPLGGSKKHFSSIPSQLNTEIVLNWLLSVPFFNVDRDRIYGVGFSMGGGAVSNYAARHKDPGAPVLAALVNHTGTVSIENAYLDDCVYFGCAAQWIFDFWFGDSTAGSASPWAMARSSTVAYDPATLAVDPDRSLAVNLLDTGVRLTRGASDNSVPYLPEQMSVLRDHLTALGAPQAVSPDYQELPYSSHDWDLLDYGATLDWLGLHVRATPAGGRVIADGNRRYYHFSLEQGSGLAFSPFEWWVDTAANAVGFESSANVQRVTVDTASAGLDTSAPLTVSLGDVGGTGDGTGDVLRLGGYAAAPSAVTRDGVPTTAWTFDAQLGTLTLQESNGAPHVWLVTP